jgi:rhodanese-related sulfurtransferase
VARKTIDEAVEEAASRLERLTAREAWEALRDGAVLVDTRSPDQQRAQGFLPAADHHQLSALAWRLDPDCATRNEKLPLDGRVVLICREGFSSIFAAVQLRELGFERATDVIGGVEAWIAAGLPVLRQANKPFVDLDEAVSG